MLSSERKTTLRIGAIFVTLGYATLVFTKWGGVVELSVIIWPIILVAVGNFFVSVPAAFDSVLGGQRCRSSFQDGLWPIRLIGALPVAAGLLLWLKGWDTSGLGHAGSVGCQWLAVAAGQFVLARPDLFEPNRRTCHHIVAGDLLPGDRRWCRGR